MGDGEWTVDADLTIRDVTRPVALGVTFRGMARDAGGKNKAALVVAAEIQRSDFQLTTELRQGVRRSRHGPRHRNPGRRRGVSQGRGVRNLIRVKFTGCSRAKRARSEAVNEFQRLAHAGHASADGEHEPPRQVEDEEQGRIESA